LSVGAQGLVSALRIQPLFFASSDGASSGLTPAISITSAVLQWLPHASSAFCAPGRSHAGASITSEI
ncbi:hypothetical protein, partial [Klebsiella quasipneumoniae]|uniref:hypothetical protein n=1 Tax=Klebsiella quasipneumoniae TaxID=1463165 RepID=UPI001BA7A558